MSVRFKIDEDLPWQIADLLNARVHNAATVVGQGWQGIPDEILWPRVQQESRWLMTAARVSPIFGNTLPEVTWA